MPSAAPEAPSLLNERFAVIRTARVKQTGKSISESMPCILMVSSLPVFSKHDSKSRLILALKTNKETLKEKLSLVDARGETREKGSRLSDARQPQTRTHTRHARQYIGLRIGNFQLLLVIFPIRSIPRILRAFQLSRTPFECAAHDNEICQQ